MKIKIYFFFCFFYFFLFIPLNIALGNENRYHYSAIVIGEKNFAIDYSYVDGGRTIGALNKAFPLKFASRKLYLPRVVKNGWPPKNFTSGISIMNTENRETNITFTLYNKEGNKIWENSNIKIAPYGFYGFWPPSQTGFPDGTEYSAIITSSPTRVVADADTRSTADADGGQRMDSYEAIPSERLTTEAYIPVILRSSYNQGWESGILIQNPNNESVTFSLTIKSIRDNSYDKKCQGFSIPPLGQKIIYFPSASTHDGCFSDMLIGKEYAGKIIATNKIAAYHSHTSATQRKSLAENVGDFFSIGSTFYIPRGYHYYSSRSFVSSFTFQNISDEASNNINIKYCSENGICSDGLNSNICNNFSLESLKSKVVYLPKMGTSSSGTNLPCIPEGDIVYSMIVALNDPNKNSLTTVYHLATVDETLPNIQQKMSFGANAFSTKEIDRVFFIPRIYKNSWTWNSGLVIQNTSSSYNKIILYILNDKGGIVLKKDYSLNSNGLLSLYIPNFNELPSNALTPTLSPIRNFDLASEIKNNKILPDFDSDGNISENDYQPWQCEYKNDGLCNNNNDNRPDSFKSSDVDFNNKVDLIDFEIWRANYQFPSNPLHP